MDDHKHDQIMRHADPTITEEESLCEGLFNLEMDDPPGDTMEKEIEDEIQGAVGQFEDIECDCSYCTDQENYVPPAKG